MAIINTVSTIYTVVSICILFIYSLINYKKMIPDKYISNLLFIILLTMFFLSISDTVPLFANFIIYTVLCVFVITYFV